MVTAIAGAGDEQEEAGQLVFQRGKKLNDEYYIVNVRDNAEGACVKFTAYELETSETYDISYSYSEFDALFRIHSELVNPAAKEGRYDWVIDRLDFAVDGLGGVKRLTLVGEPTTGDEVDEAKGSSGAAKPQHKDRLTYSERIRLRQEAEKLEEKRAANIALKAEKARKQFVADLTEKRRLEELKAQARRQRIDEERAERREKAEMQKHVNEERHRRYQENEKKRDERIQALEEERRKRDLQAIHELIQASEMRKVAMQKRLDDARQRKRDEELAVQADMKAKKALEAKVEAKRDQHIDERDARVKQAEREYLAQRERQIARIGQEKLEREERKKSYLKEKAMARAAALREKHERIEAWEQSEDLRTQNNMKKERARDILMRDHIESLRQQFEQEQAEATARKNASIRERMEREAKEAEEASERARRNAELEKKRQSNIDKRESNHQDKCQAYCAKIRDMKTAQALKIREQADAVEQAREKTREEKLRETEFRAEQELAAARVQAQREENIRQKEMERDRKFAAMVKERKQQEQQAMLEAESRRHQKRQHEKEIAQKREEQEQQRRRQVQLLEEEREAKIRQRAAERNKREQSRIGAGLGATSPKGGATADIAEDLAAAAAEGGDVDAPGSP